MKTVVTVNEMVSILRKTVNGATIVTVDLDSPQDDKMLKTGNIFLGKGIVKRETLNGMIGYIYANAVNRIASKEGKDDRIAKPHPWGDMDEKHLFRLHRKTGKPYLSMMLSKHGAMVHGFFLPNGMAVDSEAIRLFIPEKKKSSTQADLEGEAVVRDYDMANIKGMRFNGADYQIVPN